MNMAFFFFCVLRVDKFFRFGAFILSPFICPLPSRSCCLGFPAGSSLVVPRLVLALLCPSSVCRQRCVFAGDGENRTVGPR